MTITSRISHGQKRLQNERERTCSLGDMGCLSRLTRGSAGVFSCASGAEESAELNVPPALSPKSYGRVKNRLSEGF